MSDMLDALESRRDELQFPARFSVHRVPRAACQRSAGCGLPAAAEAAVELGKDQV